MEAVRGRRALRCGTGFVLRQTDACGMVLCQYRHNIIKVASRHGHGVEATSTLPPAPGHLESRARGQLHRTRVLGVDKTPVVMQVHAGEKQLERKQRVHHLHAQEYRTPQR